MFVTVTANFAKHLENSKQNGAVTSRVISCDKNRFVYGDSNVKGLSLSQPIFAKHLENSKQNGAVTSRVISCDKNRFVYGASNVKGLSLSQPTFAKHLENKVALSEKNIGK